MNAGDLLQGLYFMYAVAGILDFLIFLYIFISPKRFLVFLPLLQAIRRVADAITTDNKMLLRRHLCATEQAPARHFHQGNYVSMMFRQPYFC